MTTSPCCEKCYHDIEKGIVFALFQCEDCPCHSAPEHKESGWEEDFDKRCIGLIDGTRVAFIPLTLDFIHSLLTSQKTQQLERIRKLVEGLRSSHMDDKAYPHDDCMEVTLYNRALDDLLQVLDTDSF